MTSLKPILTAIICGFSTFSLMPNTNFTKTYSNTTGAISKTSWDKTCQNLRTSIEKVVVAIGSRNKKGKHA